MIFCRVRRDNGGRPRVSAGTPLKKFKKFCRDVGAVLNANSFPNTGGTVGGRCFFEKGPKPEFPLFLIAASRARSAAALQRAFPLRPETYHRNVSACGLAAAVWRARRDRAGVADLKGDRVCGKTLGKFVD